jgi:hypothetical protein
MLCAYDLTAHTLSEADQARARSFLDFKCKHIVGLFGDSSGYCYRDAAYYTPAVAEPNLSNISNFTAAAFNAGVYPDWATAYAKTAFFDTNGNWVGPPIGDTCDASTALRGLSGALPSQMLRDEGSYWAVAFGTLGGKVGRLVERRGNDAVVTVGALKLTVPFDTLRRMSSRHLREDRVEIAVIDAPDVDAKPEVDVRGVRVHEVDELVLQAVDNAVRADLALLRIIHGKGTGALRERVNQILKKDKRVTNFRLGAWNEGGAGVTVAEFT